MLRKQVNQIETLAFDRAANPLAVSLPLLECLCTHGSYCRKDLVLRAEIARGSESTQEGLPNGKERRRRMSAHAQ